MSFTIPKDDGKYRWTQHVVRKMMYYGLSADRVKRVIRAPKRIEEGVAPGTLASMQPTGSKKNPTEIWVMWAEKTKSKESGIKNIGANINNFLTRQKVIITAWRYPGISPVRGQVPIPADILAELQRENVI